MKLTFLNGDPKTKFEDENSVNSFYFEYFGICHGERYIMGAIEYLAQTMY